MRKSSKQKDYLERINRTLIYIQNHLDDTMTLSDLAEVSHFSQFHFHRIFTAYVGESVYNYVRRLRIVRAAGQLIYTSDRITDIALAAGFETGPAFAKAFKQVMGISPRTMRQQGANPPDMTSMLDFQPELGETIMQPTIKNIEPQIVIYIRQLGNYEKSAPAAWKKIAAYAKDNNLAQLDTTSIGITHDYLGISSEQHWRYDACIAGLENPVAAGEVGVQTLAGGQICHFRTRWSLPDAG